MSKNLASGGDGARKQGKSSKDAQKKLIAAEETKRNEVFEKHLEAVRNAQSKVDTKAPQVHASNFTRLRNHARDAFIFMRRMADNVAILTRIVTVLQTKSKSDSFRTRAKNDVDFVINQDIKYTELKRIERENAKIHRRILGAVSKTDTGIAELIKEKRAVEEPLARRIQKAPANLGWYERPFIYLYFEDDNGERVTYLPIILYPEVSHAVIKEFLQCCGNRQAARLKFQKVVKGECVECSLELLPRDGVIRQGQPIDIWNIVPQTHTIEVGSLSFPKSYQAGLELPTMGFQISLKAHSKPNKQRIVFGRVDPSHQQNFKRILKHIDGYQHINIRDCDVYYREYEAPYSGPVRLDRPMIRMYFGTEKQARSKSLSFYLYQEVCLDIVEELVLCFETQQTHRLTFLRYEEGKFLEFQFKMLRGPKKRMLDFDRTNPLAYVIDKGTISLPIDCVGGRYDELLILRVSVFTSRVKSKQRMAFGILSKASLAQFDEFLQFAAKQQRLHISDCELLHRGEFWKQKIASSSQQAVKKRQERPADVSIGWFKRPAVYLYFENPGGERIAYLPVILYPEVSQMVATEFLQCCRKRQAFRLKVEKVAAKNFVEFSLELLRHTDGTLKPGTPIQFHDGLPQSQRMEEGSLSFSWNYKHNVDRNFFFFAVSLRPRSDAAHRVVFGRVDPKHLENLKALVRYGQSEQVLLSDCDVFYKEAVVLRRPKVSLNISVDNEKYPLQLHFDLFPEIVSHVTEEFVECFGKEQSHRLTFLQLHEGLFAEFRLDLLRGESKMKPGMKLKLDEANERTHKVQKGSLTIPVEYAEGKFKDHLIFHVAAQEVPGQSSGRIVFGRLRPNSSTQFETFLHADLAGTSTRVPSCQLLSSGEPEGVIASRTDTGLRELSQRRSRKSFDFAHSIEVNWQERPRIYLYFDTDDGLRLTHLPIVLFPEVSQLLYKEFRQCCERREHTRFRIEKMVPGIMAGFTLALLEEGGVLKNGQAIDAWHDIPRAHCIERGSLMFGCSYEKGVHRHTLHFAIAANALPDHSKQYIVFGRVDPKFHHNLETFMHHATISKRKISVSDCDILEHKSEPPYLGPPNVNRPLMRFYIGDMKDPRARSFCFFLYPETCPDIVEEFVACCELRQTKRFTCRRFKTGDFLELALDMSRQRAKKCLQYKNICNLTHNIDKGSLSICKRYVGGNYESQWVFRIAAKACPRRCGERIVFGGVGKQHFEQFENFLLYAEAHPNLRIHECELLYKGEFWKQSASALEHVSGSVIDETILRRPELGSWYERPYIYIYLADSESKRVSFLPIVLYPEVSQVVALEFLKCCESRQSTRLKFITAMTGLFAEFGLELVHNGELRQRQEFDVWHAAPQSHRIEEGSLSFPSSYENGVPDTHFYFSIAASASPRPCLDRTVFGRVDEKCYANFKKVIALAESGEQLKVDDCDLYYREYVEPYAEPVILDRPVIQLLIGEANSPKTQSLCFNLYPELCDKVTRTLFECCQANEANRLELLRFEEGKFMELRLDLPKTQRRTFHQDEEKQKLVFDATQELTHKIVEGSLSVSRAYVAQGYDDHWIFQVSMRKYSQPIMSRYVFGGLREHHYPELVEFQGFAAKTNNMILSHCRILHEGVFGKESDVHTPPRRPSWRTAEAIEEAAKPTLPDSQNWIQKPYIHIYFARDDGKRLTHLPIVLYPQMAQLLASEFFQCCRRRQAYRFKITDIVPDDFIEFSLDLLKEHGFLKRGQEMKIMTDLPSAHLVKQGSVTIARSIASGISQEAINFRISLKSQAERHEGRVVFGHVEPEYYENLEYLLQCVACEHKIHIYDCDVFFREQVVPFTDPSLFNFETSRVVPHYLGWHERPYFYLHFEGDNGQRISYVPIMLYPEVSQMLTDEFLQCARKRQAFRMKVVKIIPGEFIEFRLQLLKESGVLRQGGKIFAIEALTRAQSIEAGSLTLSKNYLNGLWNDTVYFSIALRARAELSANRLVFGRVDPKHYANLAVVLDVAKQQRSFHVSDCDVFYREKAPPSSGPLKHNRPLIRFYLGIGETTRALNLSFYLYPEVVGELTEELAACCLNKHSQRLTFVRSEADLFAEFRLELLRQGGKLKAGKRFKFDFRNKRAHKIESGSLSIPVKYALCGCDNKLSLHLAGKAIPGEVPTRIVVGKLAKESRQLFDDFWRHAAKNEKIYFSDCELLYGDEYLRQTQDIFSIEGQTIPRNIEWVPRLCGWYERPLIYLYFARDDERRLTYLPIKLYKEVAPEIVSLFLKCCSERKAECMNLITSVSGEFMEFSFELLKETSEFSRKKPLTLQRSSALAINVEAGSLSFPQIYEYGISTDVMQFNINAKAHARPQAQHYVFGRVDPQYFKHFEILQRHIADGTNVHICDCDIYYTPYEPVQPDRPIIQLFIGTPGQPKARSLYFTLYPERCRKVVAELVDCCQNKKVERLFFADYKEDHHLEFALTVERPGSADDTLEIRNKENLTHKIDKGTLSIARGYLEDNGNESWILHLAVEDYEEPIACRIAFGSLCDDQLRAFDDFVEYAKENQNFILAHCELEYSGEF